MSCVCDTIRIYKTKDKVGVVMISEFPISNRLEKDFGKNSATVI